MIRVLISHSQGKRKFLLNNVRMRLFSDIETVQITEKTVNPQGERVSPHDFQLLKVLGKGGYGKVC